MRRAYDVHRLLGRFFADPLDFRSLQARTGTVISGSVALQFFSRAHYPSADLDLYLHMRHRKEVGLWVVEQGYDFVPAAHQPKCFVTAVKEAPYLFPEAVYTLPGIAAIFTFVKTPNGGRAEPTKVQLIIATNSPMEVVLGFHSSKEHFDRFVSGT